MIKAQRWLLSFALLVFVTVSAISPSERAE